MQTSMFLLSMTPKIARTFHARLTRTALRYAEQTNAALSPLTLP